jgi:hypothetical protein
MTVAARTSSYFPSPLAGEGVERMRRMSEAGEGSGFSLRTDPSPGRSLRSRPPSPARGEGKKASVR